MEQGCENCKYFVKYYYKDEYGRYLLLIGAGHCKNPDLSKKSTDKIIKSKLPCDKFRANVLEGKTKTKQIFDKLKHAKLLLYDITRLLKDD